MTDKKITITSDGEYYGIFINGKCVYQHDYLHPFELLNILNIKYDYKIIDDNWFG